MFRIRFPFAARGHPNAFDPELRASIEREFANILQTYELDGAEFRCYKAECGYAEKYVSYMGPRLLDEKLLEHFVSIKLLHLLPGDVVIDIGSAASPFADYIERAIGCRTYSLDLGYKPGIHGREIGASADAIPLESGSVDAMTLHCTIDHFEGDCDARFIREAARVLHPGGRLCILPVYFAPEPTNICDPRYFSPRAKWDHEARLRAVQDYHNRFGRYYSVESFRRRILNTTNELKPSLYRVEGDRPKIPNNYLHYALVMTRHG